MKFFRDGEGNPGVEGGSSSQLIDRFLTEDIQDSPATCRRVLMTIQRIFLGEVSSWRQVGNAHVLSLSTEGAVVESLFEQEARPSRLSLEDFQEILQSWLHFLEENEEP
jgi:hypothetical protein